MHRLDLLTSIRARVMLLVILVTLPALGLSLATGVADRRAAGQTQAEHVLELPRLAAREHARLLNQTKQLLLTMAELPAVLDLHQCDTALERLLTRYPEYANISVISSTGVTICDGIPGQTNPAGVADRLFFQRALQTKEFAVGEYTVDRVSAKAILLTGLPLLDEAGEVSRVLLAGIDLTWLDQFAKDAKLPDGSRLAVSDQNGNILARWPNPLLFVGRNSTSAGLVGPRLAAGEVEGTGEGVGLEGIARIYGFTRLDVASADQPTFISVATPAETAYAAADLALRRHLVGISIAGLLGLVVAWIGSEALLIRRLHRLTNASRQLAAGDRGARSGMATNRDELGQLAHAFDTMADAVSVQRTALELAREEAESAAKQVQQLNDDLEQRVTIQTSTVRRSLSLLQAAFDSTADGLLVVDLTGNVSEANQQFYEMWRIPAELRSSSSSHTLVGGPEETPRRVLDQISDPASYMRKVHYIYDHPDQESIDEYDFIDGRSFERYSLPQVMDGKIVGRVWSYRDMTARVQAEREASRAAEFARLAEEIAHVGSWQWDVQADEMRWSDEMCRLHGHDPATFKSTFDLALQSYHADDRALIAANIQRSLRIEGSGSGEYRVTLPDGSVRTHEVSWKTHRDLNGNPTLMVGANVDITNRRAGQQAIQAALVEKETLLREIHHRVKNNLQVISSLLYFQAQKVTDPADAAVWIEGQNRLRSMILVHERLYQSADLTHIDFADYTRTLLEQLVTSFSTSETVIRSQVHIDELSLPIEQALPLGMLITELTINAFKHAFRGQSSGTVRVTAQLEGDWLELVVADNGVGLPPDFSPDRARSFGTRLVVSLARQLNASLDFASHQGTSVTIRVPRSNEALARNESAEPSSSFSLTPVTA